MNYNLKKAQQKLIECNTDFKGKKGTFEFFNNMITTLKKVSSKKNDTEETCTICLCEFTGDDIGLTSCGHMYCFNCISQSIQANQACPVCRKKITMANIHKISYEIPVVKTDNIEIKDKISLINKIGTKLTNLVMYIRKYKCKRVIFSQWDSMLINIGDVLNTYGIKNVFCRGNVWVRDKAIRDFTNIDDIDVIMLSSESAASGTNLTAAEEVILIDPIYGNYETRRNAEWQAIGRVYRMGQTKQVRVVRLIMKDTVEEEIYYMNIEDDKKYKEDISMIHFEDDMINMNEEEIENIAKIADENEKKKIIKIKTSKKKKTPKANESDNDSNNSDNNSENDNLSDHDNE